MTSRIRALEVPATAPGYLRPLRIGLLAPEFSTQHGGMQEMARELVERLAESAECQVFARANRVVPSTAVPVQPLLESDLRRCRALLASAAQPDVWLALNAGVAALAPHLGAPLVVYVNGNDLLEPWFGFGRTVASTVGNIRGLELAGRAMTRRAFRADALKGVRSARLVLTNSTNTSALVRLHVGSAPEIRIVEPGVGDAFFRSDRDDARRARTSGSPLRVLTVTRLTTAAQRKNVDGVLRAVATLPASVVSHYTIAGDGDDRPRLEELTRQLGIRDRVTFAGSPQREELIALYDSSDIFVLAASASDRDVEGFGIVYLEASAGGIPVLASRSGGATDAVAEGENGLLVPDGSPAAIAAGISAVQRGDVHIDPARARAVAERNRWSNVSERMLHELRSVLPDA